MESRYETMLNGLYAVLADNRYVALILCSILLFGLSYATLPILLIPGARLSFLSILNSFSTIDLVILTIISLMFGLVTALQVYEIRRISKGFKIKHGASVGGTVAGLIAAKSCCILPLLLLMLGSTSSALLVASRLTELRLVSALIMGIVFTVTAVRVGNGVNHV